MDSKKFTDQIEAQIKEWEKHVADFQAKSADVSAEMKKKYDEQISAMNESIAKAQAMAEKTKAANEAAWNDMATGAKRSFEEWQKAVQSAMDRYRT